MKHAIMIMAHKNFEFLHHLIEYFTHDCYVFVHIDKKSSITRDEEACLRAMPQVSGVYRKYSVHWGGFSILKCEIFLMKEALHSCDADYFHLISGQDYPIKPLSYFLQFFEERKGYEFISYVHLPHPKWGKNTYSRFQYFYIFDLFNNKNRARKISSKFIKWQKRLKIKKAVPFVFDHLYGNSQWFSITRVACYKLILYTIKHPKLLKKYKWSFAPEESYISTVLLNVIPMRQVMSFNLRYINWKYENGNSPANLDMRHLFPILKGNYLFARKFEKCSHPLLEVIDKFLLDTNEIKVLPSGVWEYDNYFYYSFDNVFLKSIISFCKYAKVDTIIDVGCGPGMYVKGLRDKGFHAIGLDGNPFLQELSKYIMSDDASHFYTQDITDNIMPDFKADLVVCKDVLPYIHHKKIEHVVCNICKMAKKYILLNLDVPLESRYLTDVYYRHDLFYIKSCLFNMNFYQCEFETNYINRAIRNMFNHYYIFKSYEKN